MTTDELTTLEALKQLLEDGQLFCDSCGIHIKTNYHFISDHTGDTFCFCDDCHYEADILLAQQELEAKASWVN